MERINFICIAIFSVWVICYYTTSKTFTDRNFASTLCIWVLSWVNDSYNLGHSSSQTFPNKVVEKLFKYDSEKKSPIYYYVVGKHIYFSGYSIILKRIETYLSTVKATMVKIEEYVTVSVVNIRASQIASPNTHGYCRQSQYNSKGMAEKEEKMKANLTMSEIGNRTISQDCISLGLKNQVEISCFLLDDSDVLVL